MVPEIRSQKIDRELASFYIITGPKVRSLYGATAWYLHIRERMHQLLQVIRIEAYLIMQNVIVSWPRSPLEKKHALSSINSQKNNVNLGKLNDSRTKFQ